MVTKNPSSTSNDGCPISRPLLARCGGRPLVSPLQDVEKSQALTKTFWQTTYFAPLDGLRALALLLVIAAHVRTALPIRTYFSGGLGVGIFFVLSGFLITILLLREETAAGDVSLGSFYIRRAFRILPPYLLALAAYLVVGMIPSQHELRTKFLNGLPYFLSLRNEYIPGALPVAFTHSWSLSVEEKFYFVWPLLFFVLLRHLKSRWAVVPITLAPLLLSTRTSLPVAYFSLLTGCCVALALHTMRRHQESLLLQARRIPASLVYLVWVLSYLASLRAEFRVSFILCTAVVLPLLLLRQTWLSRALGANACTWVGKRTYSMYLFHAFCLTATEGKLNPTTVARYFAVIGISFLLSLAVASVVYVVLERPAISWGRKLANAYAARSTKAQMSEYTAVLHR
jgi:peptidoglycan/LPS O-acetylase OafA/YrhL